VRPSCPLTVKLIRISSDHWQMGLIRVLHSAALSLLKQNYHVLRFNSRGVGRSTGWSSFSGASEAKDLQALVQWGLENVADVHSVVIVVSFSDS
jgi:alpha/beta superfamily hydrolase